MKDLICLTDLIGYKSPCETTASRSGYYLNNLKGFSFQFAENIANEEWQNAKKYLDDLILTAKNMVIDEMEQHLRPYFQFNRVLTNQCLCNHIDGYDTVYAGNRGVKIMKLPGTQRPYQRIVVPRISIWIETTADVIIVIDDGGKITTYDAVNVIGGELTEFYLDYHAQSDTVKIYFDQTAIQVRKTSCMVGCSTCGTATPNNQNYQIMTYGFDALTTYSDNFFGIVPCVGLECSMDNLVCAFSDNLGLPLLYKVGGLFYSDVEMTDRNNRFTLYKKERAREMSIYYDADEQTGLGAGINVPPGMYQKQMKSVINSIFPYLENLNDECIQCSGARYEFILP